MNGWRTWGGWLSKGRRTVELNKTQSCGGYDHPCPEGMRLTKRIEGFKLFIFFGVLKSKRYYLFSEATKNKTKRILGDKNVNIA